MNPVIVPAVGTWAETNASEVVAIPLAVVVSEARLVYAKLEDLELISLPRKLQRLEAKNARAKRKAMNGHMPGDLSPEEASHGT